MLDLTTGELNNRRHKGNEERNTNKLVQCISGSWARSTFSLWNAPALWIKLHALICS